MDWDSVVFALLGGAVSGFWARSMARDPVRHWTHVWFRRFALAVAIALPLWAAFTVVDRVGLQPRTHLGKIVASSEGRYPPASRITLHRGPQEVGHIVVEVPEGVLTLGRSYRDAPKLLVTYRVGRISGWVYPDSVDTGEN